MRKGLLVVLGVMTLCACSGENGGAIVAGDGLEKAEKLLYSSGAFQIDPSVLYILDEYEGRKLEVEWYDPTTKSGCVTYMLVDRTQLIVLCQKGRVTRLALGPKGQGMNGIASLSHALANPQNSVFISKNEGTNMNVRVGDDICDVTGALVFAGAKYLGIVLPNSRVVKPVGADRREFTELEYIMGSSVINLRVEWDLAKLPTRGILRAIIVRDRRSSPKVQIESMDLARGRKRN